MDDKSGDSFQSNAAAAGEDEKDETTQDQTKQASEKENEEMEQLAAMFKRSLSDKAALEAETKTKEKEEKELEREKEFEEQMAAQEVPTQPPHPHHHLIASPPPPTPSHLATLRQLQADWDAHHANFVAHLQRLKAYWEKVNGMRRDSSAQASAEDLDDDVSELEIPSSIVEAVRLGDFIEQVVQNKDLLKRGEELVKKNVELGMRLLELRKADGEVVVREGKGEREGGE